MGRPLVTSDPTQLRAAVAAARRQGKSIGVVPTMGALHRGHVSLVEASCRECGFTVVTVFVNPTQFGPHEDFHRYPRDLETDLQQIASLPVDVVFTPATEEMYPPGHQTFVEVSEIARPLEGAHRPGHFRGVATVVLKLFNLVAPDVAFFGQKDYQQSLVVRRMTADLDLPIEIRICPTVREADGLAMSSRNVYLSARQRQQALVLYRSLKQGADLAARGERSAATILAAMNEIIASEPEVRLDYLVLADPKSLAEIKRIDGPVVALIAAHVGKTRLIDNMLIDDAKTQADE